MIKRWKWSPWPDRVAWLLCVCTIASTGFLVFAWLLPQRLYIVWWPYRIAAVISFFGRVFTFHIGVALGVAMVAALFLRRRRLGIIAAVAAAAALSPTISSLREKQTAAAAGPTVRVMAMNLYALNQDEAHLSAAVRDANPDVIVLEEFTPFHQAVFDRVLREGYPYRSLEPRETLRIGGDCLLIDAN